MKPLGFSATRFALLAFAAANGVLTKVDAATASGTVYGVKDRQARATICLESNPTACWLTRMDGSFQISYPSSPTAVAAHPRTPAQITNGQLVLQVGLSGRYVLEAVNSLGMRLDEQELDLVDGVQQIPLTSNIQNSRGLVFLRLSGPGGTWVARLLRGKGTVSQLTTAFAGPAARAAAIGERIIVSANSYVSQTITLSTDSAQRQNLSIHLTRDLWTIYFTPDPGVFTKPFLLGINSRITINGIVRFTTDGSLPSILSEGVSGLLSIGTDTTIRAQLFVKDVPQGSVASGNWYQSRVVPAAGTYQGVVHVTASKLVGDERYTLDGSIPTNTSAIWNANAGLDLDQDAFLVIRSLSTNYLEGAEYTIQDTSLTPSGVGTAFFDTTLVTLSDKWPDAEIHYTLDGSLPTQASPLYSKPIGIWHTCNVKAVAYRQGYASSVKTIPFALVSPTPRPVFETRGYRSFSDSVLVTIYDLNAGLPVHYTLDGTYPTSASPIYTKPFFVKSTKRVIAGMGSRNPSLLTESDYILDGTPKLSPDSGLTPSQNGVAVTMTSSSAVIRYTLDGSDPTTLSPGYTTAVTPKYYPATIKAAAFVAGARSSYIMSVTYTQTDSGIVAVRQEFLPTKVASFSFMVDERDGRGYPAVQINGQNWMVMNLNYEGAGTCATGDCANSGRAYTWSETMNGAAATDAIPSHAQGICPKGWHVPSAGEIGAIQYNLQDSTPEGGRFDHGSWWSTTENPLQPHSAYVWSIQTGGYLPGKTSELKDNRYSVRCVQTNQ